MLNGIDVCFLMSLTDACFAFSTVPERNSLNDFSYGDKKEFITASYLLLSGIIDYCFSSEAMFLDPKCSNLNIPGILSNDLHLDDD